MTRNRLSLALLLVCAITGCQKSPAGNGGSRGGETPKTATAPSTQPATDRKSFTPTRGAGATKDRWTVVCDMTEPGEVTSISVWFDSKQLERFQAQGIKDTIVFADDNGGIIDTHQVFPNKDSIHFTKYDEHEDGETFAYNKGEANFDKAKHAVEGTFSGIAQTRNSDYGMKVVMRTLDRALWQYSKENQPPAKTAATSEDAKE
jgi:hypothetical protein